MDALDVIRNALHSECGLDPATISQDSDLLKDLGVDSLDLLNASYRIEKECGITLPVETWLQEEYGEAGAATRRFRVAEICAFIDRARLRGKEAGV